MASIQDVVRYFVLHYPYPHELSKTRLTKMVYLADWLSAQRQKRQITEISWFFDHYGPYVSDVYDTARKDRELKIELSFSAYGTPKETIVMRAPNDHLATPTLSDDDKAILDDVINNTCPLSWTKFIDYVYSTYPIQTLERYSSLNLVDLAIEMESESS